MNILKKNQGNTTQGSKKNALPETGVLVGDSENPYLTARRSWNNHTSSIVASRQMWQILGILSLIVALAGVGGMIVIGSQSKFVPYVIEVDKLGQAAAVSRVEKAAPVDQRIIRAYIASFISNARIVTPDVALQRKAIISLYAMLAPRDPAIKKMNEWLHASEESTPFVRAQKEMVSVEIDNVLPETPETWQVNWIETTRDRQGALIDKPVHMHAIVIIYTVEPTANTTEKQLQENPMGIFVRDFSWSKQI